MKVQNRKKAAVWFTVMLLACLVVMTIGVIKTERYNRKRHHKTFSGPALFAEGSTEHTGISVQAVPRSSTWEKVFDTEEEGQTENSYQAYTYDFTIANHTKDEVSDFSFRLTFSRQVYLASAWNGALEIHQHTEDAEIVDTVPDLRTFVPEEHTHDTVTVDGESFVSMQAGDYLIYIPSSAMSAREMPIGPHEGTTPGIILYTALGESIEDSSLEMEFTFHRLLTQEPLFWITVAGFMVWLAALLIYLITSAQIRQYQERHERDNEIINESIETFTGFIDAKDPYTNGHSKRVAIYTKQIAKELGFTGEELDRIYYMALLHDCGKIGVPDNILGKPGRLTAEEFEIIKSHTVRGSDILRSFKSLEDADEGARFHHERYDGKGYPEGKAGEEIPFIARMICVADSFDAMNSNRVYRKKLTREQVLAELEKNRGTQFDPRVADVMLGLLRDGRIKIGE